MVIPDNIPETAKIIEANELWKGKRLSDSHRKKKIRGNITELRSYRDDYHKYLDQYAGVNPDRDNHANRMITELAGKIEALKEKPVTEPPADNTTQRITKNFRVTNQRDTKQGGYRLITINYEGNEGKIVSFDHSCGDRVEVNNDRVKSKIVLRVSGQVECSGYLKIPDLDLALPPTAINTKNDPLVANFEAKGENLFVKYSGGEGPFHLVAVNKNGTPLAKTTKPVANDTRITENTELKFDSDIPPGEYFLEVVDKSGISFANARSKEAIYTVHRTLGDFMIFLLPLLIIGLGAGIYFLYLKTKSDNSLTDEQREELEARIATATGQSTNETSTEEEVENGVRSKIVIGKKAGLVASATALSGTRPRPHAMTDARGIEGLLAGSASEYRRVKMSDVWQRTMVTDIYLRDLFVKGIHDHVFEQRALRQNQGQAVPEIGGWILGKKMESGSGGSYQLSFERFVPIEKDVANSTTQLTFDTNAWNSLDKAQDYYGHMEFEVVGWFHTHPGWGVFLSGEDINTHETFFSKPFHVAMEMESLNSPHDIGFFSRYRTGNKVELNTKSEKYHDWKDFSSWIGQKIS